MLSVPTISRQVIDSWLIPESGLPTRVVNSLASEGIVKVGELREIPDARLLGFRSLGRISLDHIRSFFLLCNNIAEGRQAFNDIQEVATIVFDDDEWRIIQARYGCHSDAVELRPYYATLQEIGVSTGKTRERIRQIQEIALQKLQSRLATACLQPFFKEANAFIRSHACMVTGDEVTQLRGAAWLAECNPSGVLALFSELPAAGFNYYHHGMATLAVPALMAIEQEALQFLTAQAGPVPLDLIAKALTPPPALANERQILKVTGCLLDHNETVAATLDGRYFAFSTGIDPYLRDLLGQLQRPAHYRAVMQAFNDRVKPRSRKGAGFILDTLNAHPQFTRVDRGIYDLKA